MFTNWKDIDRMFGTMDLLQGKLDRLFSGYGRLYEDNPVWETVDYFPKTNLYDTGENLDIMAEIPAFPKENISVKIQGNYLEISGTAKSDAPEGYAALRAERGLNNFSRSFTLPAEVDSEKVEALMKNGILFLRLPKAVAAKPRKITIG